MSEYEKMTDYERRNVEEVREANAKSEGNIFTVIGWIVTILGLLFGVIGHNLNALLTNGALGVIICGVGSILNAMYRYNKQRK